MKIYHFTCLMHLPEIFREGITRGEVPINTGLYKNMPQAANLTTDPRREEQFLWTGQNNGFDKTRIRLTIDIPDSELTSFRQVKEKYQIRASWLKTIAPYHARQHWYFAFNGVRTDQIKHVEIWRDGEYVPVEDLPKMIQEIEVERDRTVIYGVETHGIATGAISLRIKPGCKDSWLLDGHHFQNALIA